MSQYALVLTGDTFRHREALKHRGFRWQPGERAWVKFLSDSDLVGGRDLELQRWVKGLSGVTLTQEHAFKFRRLGRR